MIPAIGQLVIYGTNGICRVEDKRTEALGGAAKEYFILRSLSDKRGMTIYLPTDSEQLLATVHPILSPEELAALVRDTLPLADGEWPADARTRTKRTREILASGNRARLIALVKTLHRDALRDSARGKKPTPSSEAARARACEMLYEEFALAFEMQEEDTLPFLLGELTPAVREK